MNNIHDDSGNNNTPDYENNLAFDPTSADDLNEQGRKSEVLIKALEKCEKLEKQLKIAVEALKNYADRGYYSLSVLDEWNCINEEAQQALEQIEEIDK